MGSRSKVKVGAIKGHEYSTARTHGSTDWSQTNIEDLCSIGDSQKQSHILGRQRKCWFLGARTNRLYLTELEKFMMSPVQINGGTFRQNLTLLIKELKEPLPKS